MTTLETQREAVAAAKLAPNALFASYRAMAELMADVLEGQHADYEARQQARRVLVRIAKALDDITAIG